MNVELIRDDASYNRAMKRLLQLMDLQSAENTPESDELEFVFLMIEHYELRTFPALTYDPDPIEEIEFHLDRLGLTRRDLIPILGSESRVSEILNRKRPLTLAMIRRLHKELGMSADVLLELTGPASLRKAS